MRTSRIVIAAFFIVVGIVIAFFAPPVHGSAKTVISVGCAVFLAAMFVRDVRRHRADRREANRETRIQVLDGGDR